MAASILNTNRAIEVNVFIVRAFVKLRHTISEHKELTHKIAQMEQHLADHDEQILSLIMAIKQFINTTPLPQKRRIGFDTNKN